MSLQLFHSMRGRLIACSCASYAQYFLMHVSLPPEILVIDKISCLAKSCDFCKGIYCTGQQIPLVTHDKLYYFQKLSSQ